ncbi:unnamed protein product [Caenorhabditis angaria]|uniref:Uncharacterized protein n=1 Tax=Caenorhabditis angaria TaxID=860376 RepID=A0A9P1MS24_9PELO|nr:unnamed protein product [Caenorhabditis angaria]
MEWRNDVLSFSGFDYGVALKNNENKFDQLSEIQEISEDEISRKSENVERDKYLRTTYISSLSDEIAESTAIEPNLSIEENAKKEKANTKRLDFEAINERAVENLYFRNVEQAEKKLTMISQMRNKWRKAESMEI